MNNDGTIAGTVFYLTPRMAVCMPSVMGERESRNCHLLSQNSCLPLHARVQRAFYTQVEPFSLEFEMYLLEN